MEGEKNWTSVWDRTGQVIGCDPFSKTYTTRMRRLSDTDVIRVQKYYSCSGKLFGYNLDKMKM